VALLAIALPGVATAQAGPSFDCAKAATAVEKAICGDKEASAADRKMAEAYRTLLASLVNPAARAHLQRDQSAWMGDRRRVCAPPRLQVDADRTMPACLRDLALVRAGRLANLPTGDAYPFVGERRLVERGRRGGVPYDITVSYAAFERPDVDGTRVNAAIKGWVDKLAAYARPPAKAEPGTPDIGYFLEAGHEIHVAARDLVTVAAFWQLYAGGAHPNSGRTAWQVQPTTGRMLGLDDILDRASGWQDGVTRLVRDDLKKQFAERPGFEESLEPAALHKLVAESRRWIFFRDKLTLTFDPYEVGPYASGPYEVELPYAALAPYIRKDGPLGDRAR
jgi:uncharacterized protein YecT (DUF1311 family)